MNIVDLMADVNGSTFISLCTRTVPILREGKKNPFLGRVHKVVLDSNVMVFQNKRIHGYDAMVRRRLEQEGKDPQSFVLGERQWGKRIPNTPFIEHKGQHYLEVIFLRCGKIFYTVDGIEAPKESIAGLAETPEPKAESQGGLENKVVIRTYKIDSIMSLTINKKKHEKLTFKIE